MIFVNKFPSFNASVLFSNCLDSFSSNSLYISMISLNQNYTLTRLSAREDIIKIIWLMQPQIWYTLPMIPHSIISYLPLCMIEISLCRNFSLCITVQFHLLISKRSPQMFLLFSSPIKVLQLPTDVVLHSIICDNQNDQCSPRQALSFVHSFHEARNFDHQLPHNMSFQLYSCCWIWGE